MRRYILKNIALFSGAMFFVIDRFLKVLAINNSESLPINILGNWFSFDFTPNYYMAFSLPINRFWLLFLTGIIISFILIYIIYFILEKKCDNNNFYLLTFLAFGAISNFIDRLNYGYVIDYFSVSFFSVFNLADILIIFSVFSIIFLNLKKTNNNGKYSV